jgi:hypothetical protein
MQLARAVAILLAALTLAACVGDPPVAQPPPVDTDSLHGVIVVNEGVWGQDNATLTFFDPLAGVALQDFFARQNPGERLGDTGNDILVDGDRAYVPVTTSQNVEVIALPSARSLGRVRIASGDPREVAIVDDSTAYVSLLAADAIIRFDPRTLVTGARTPVGPAPEGIAALGGRVFVANSGLGFFRRSEPGAGTLSVIDAATGLETTRLAVGANPVAVESDARRGRIYLLYGMPFADSIGGVIAIDASTLDEVGRWMVRGAGVAGEMAVDEERGLIYVVDGDGDLVRIASSTNESPVRFLAHRPPTTLGYYGVGVSPVDGTIYASAVRGYTVPARVHIFSRDGAPRGTFDAGLNPSGFGFF